MPTKTEYAAAYPTFCRRSQRAVLTESPPSLHSRSWDSGSTSCPLSQVSWCLKQLESHLHALQKAPDVPERKPWRHEGSSYIGKQTRRFFPQGGGFVHSNGVLTGWLPAEGEEPALWHMQHEDGDEEDLEEFEVVWAIESFVESRTEPVEEEAAAAVKAAKEAEAEAAKEAAKEAKRAAREDGEDSDDSGDGRGKGDANAKAHEAHGDSERLWLSSECRERWQARARETSLCAPLLTSLQSLLVPPYIQSSVLSSVSSRSDTRTPT
eukprot:2343829-Pleurochrysis_carterae.AAC.6